MPAYPCLSYSEWMNTSTAVAHISGLAYLPDCWQDAELWAEAPVEPPAIAAEGPMQPYRGEGRGEASHSLCVGVKDLTDRAVRHFAAGRGSSFVCGNTCKIAVFLFWMLLLI